MNALPFEPSVANGVMLLSRLIAVVLSVDFDRKSRFDTEEIQHVRAGRMLPPEA